MSQKNQKVKQMVVTALLAAFVCVCTIVISIPMPGTDGFVNFGDTIIFVSGTLFGPVVGGLAGGIGSALGDLILGYVHWVPFTFVIKGLEGVLVGAVAHKAFRAKGSVCWQAIMGVLLGAAWMVLGYFVASIFLYGLAASAASVPGNLIQGGVSLVLSIPLMLALKKLKLQ